MKLYTSPTSPFARKVAMAAIERGLWDGIEAIPADPYARPAALTAANPLSKVPVLVTADGRAIADSFAICLFLDSLGTAPPVFPVAEGIDHALLQRHILADGIADAALVRRVEGLKAAEPDRRALIADLGQVIARALDAAEAQTADFGKGATLDALALGAALGYLDFRFAHEPWRPGRPGLTAWYTAYAARPAMTRTAPPG
jgi:glutathione S-transferase